MASSTAAQLEPLSLSIPEAARLIGVSRSQVYVLMDAGELSSIKLGRRRLIPTASVRELLARLGSAAGQAA
jgi:excisionase family DNA binding protein